MLRRMGEHEKEAAISTLAGDTVYNIRMVAHDEGEKVGAAQQLVCAMF